MELKQAFWKGFPDSSLNTNPSDFGRLALRIFWALGEVCLDQRLEHLLLYRDISRGELSRSSQSGRG